MNLIKNFTERVKKIYLDTREYIKTNSDSTQVSTAPTENNVPHSTKQSRSDLLSRLYVKPNSTLSPLLTVPIEHQLPPSKELSSDLLSRVLSKKCGPILGHDSSATIAALPQQTTLDVGSEQVLESLAGVPEHTPGMIWSWCMACCAGLPFCWS